MFSGTGVGGEMHMPDTVSYHQGRRRKVQDWRQPDPSLCPGE